MAIVASYSIGIVLALIFPCQPIAMNWDLSITEGKCIDKAGIYLATAAVNVIVSSPIMRVPRGGEVYACSSGDILLSLGHSYAQPIQFADHRPSDGFHHPCLANPCRPSASNAENEENSCNWVVYGWLCDVHHLDCKYTSYTHSRIWGTNHVSQVRLVYMVPMVKNFDQTSMCPTVPL